ncbi:UDP-N-acetylglucosamine transferase subunit alg13 [Aspergillus heteromorphus CBS 117.55]|uniref:UDP-N-acetylglucosamine transferase subunit ALG13 n=1 Tax=Aspergillus heteromorphus CBS 117.55 TaxID=1448321 RepID=A0A317WW40_9EURO|nr:UDP-N-acetylglucosamine transferase subunit alg13 [Aspergillus heteromorphus CBS 117.55]PWY88520.1 UDP-N-acetylglucosamine transferase subunit alg13 [Aspergillus heteromorphus CBS 117.55]
MERPIPMRARSPIKVCFVTVGATASFHELLQTILQEDFLQVLRRFGYTNLLIQYGKDGKSVWDAFERQYPPHTGCRNGLLVEGFDFNPDGLDEEMRMARSNLSKGHDGGLIISHAGSGSILGAMRLGVPLVVVPNSTLKDNHQQELADELQSQGYVIASSCQNLSAAIGRGERLRAQMLAWPPVCAVSQRRQRSLQEVMSDELGFLD